MAKLCVDVVDTVVNTVSMLEYCFIACLYGRIGYFCPPLEKLNGALGLGRPFDGKQGMHLKLPRFPKLCLGGG